MQPSREAFVVCPWEVEAAVNDAHLAVGMTNAYCIVAKWKHDNPLRRAFQPLGQIQKNIPGCLHLIVNDCATSRNWAFRTTVALKISDVLSKASLTTHTRQSLLFNGVPPSSWEHFKKRTIPDEKTERKGIVTKRTIRKNLVVEMLRDNAVKHFARFDTAPQLALLMGYFGRGIQGAGRIRRFAGPPLTRTGPVPSYLARRLNNGESVGAIIGLPVQPTMRYHSTEPGIDILYNPPKRQLTVRVRYQIAGIANPTVREELLGLPPLPALLITADANGGSAIENMTQFEYEGTLYLVRHLSIAGDEVICEVVEPGNDELEEFQEVTLPFDVVQHLL